MKRYLCKKSMIIAGKEVYTEGKEYKFEKVKDGILNYRLEGNGNGGLGVFEKRDMKLFKKHFKEVH